MRAVILIYSLRSAFKDPGSVNQSLPPPPPPTPFLDGAVNFTLLHVFQGAAPSVLKWRGGDGGQGEGESGGRPRGRFVFLRLCVTLKTCAPLRPLLGLPRPVLEARWLGAELCDWVTDNGGIMFFWYNASHPTFSFLLL